MQRGDVLSPGKTLGSRSRRLSSEDWERLSKSFYCRAWNAMGHWPGSSSELTCAIFIDSCEFHVGLRSLLRTNIVACAPCTTVQHLFVHMLSFTSPWQSWRDSDADPTWTSGRGLGLLTIAIVDRSVIILATGFVMESGMTAVRYVERWCGHHQQRVRVSCLLGT